MTIDELPLRTHTRRVLTGMRTTGPLHVGHYVGALKQWLAVQESGEYECFFLLADVQALTTHADRPVSLPQSIRDAALDWLSVGLDPTRPNVHFVLQSAVVGRADISILLQMLAPWAEIRRNPTLKAEMADLSAATMGFLTYPVDQVADIYMISPCPPRKGDEVLVPVGDDQVPHLEYARLLARRFNRKYGVVFVPCRPLLGDVGRLPGIDGRAKMSKSLDNAIYLSDDRAAVDKKVMSMYTDPTRTRSDIPGNPDGNPVFLYHDAFNADRAEVESLKDRYRRGAVGDVEVKRTLAAAINNVLEPVRARRAMAAQLDLHEMIADGSAAASAHAGEVLRAMKESMFLRLGGP